MYTAISGRIVGSKRHGRRVVCTCRLGGARADKDFSVAGIGRGHAGANCPLRTSQSSRVQVATKHIDVNAALCLPLEQDKVLAFFRAEGDASVNGRNWRVWDIGKFDGMLLL